jgi:hypothetical protein
MRWVTAATIFFALGGIRAQEAHDPEPTLLIPSGSQALELPHVMYYAVRCDGNGHLFYRLVRTDNAFEKSVVMKVDLKSPTPTLYQQPSEDADSALLEEFAITPSGRVWYLDIFKEKPGATALGFDSDGHPTSHVHLDIPTSLVITTFAAADDDSFLVGGFYNADAASELRGKSYLAAFGRTGRVTKEADADLPTQDLKAFAKGAFLYSPVTAGVDGNFYVLEGDSILVMSEGGDIIRRLKVRRPPGDGHVYEMALSSGLLSIEYLIPNGDGTLRPEFVVLDTATGAPYATYRPAPELGSVCLCFSRQDGYTFSHTDKGKTTLLTAPLR